MRSALTAALLLTLVACGEEPQGAPPIAETADEERIGCATGGATELEPVCRVERQQGAEGLQLTIHAPDGGFRRLLVVEDGRGVVAADGAEQARVSVVGEEVIEVAIGSERYRLPATIQGQ